MTELFVLIASTICCPGMLSLSSGTASVPGRCIQTLRIEPSTYTVKPGETRHYVCGYVGHEWVDSPTYKRINIDGYSTYIYWDEKCRWCGKKRKKVVDERWVEE